MSEDPIVTPGFTGRHREHTSKLPPGQYETRDFPVLSAGPTPRVSLETWAFTITNERGEKRAWNWNEFRALPRVAIHTDIHCVTRWSKFDTDWEGVALDTLLDGIATDASYAMAHSYGGYTTNVPLADLRGGKAWIADTYGGDALDPEHGGPARLLVPHLYLWKSAKWINGLTLMRGDEPGFWERLGYNMYGDPWREQRYTGD